jgi:hypothetical protein
MFLPNGHVSRQDRGHYWFENTGAKIVEGFHTDTADNVRCPIGRSERLLCFGYSSTLIVLWTAI